MILPPAEDRMLGAMAEEELAVIQTIFGENDRAMSTLTELSRTPYPGPLNGGMPLTPALLRLDPIWTRCAAIPLSKTLRGEAAINPAKFSERSGCNQGVAYLPPMLGMTETAAQRFNLVMRVLRVHFRGGVSSELLPDFR